MCGIAGKIYFKKQQINKDAEIPLIKKTLDVLHHRGPDDSGYVIDKDVWLGTTRLSIIDLSLAGHQPMRNEDGTLLLIFNGEIYNYKEIKKHLTRRHKLVSETDSEMLLHLYEEKGIRCLKYLRGMFAFAIWDKKKQELFIARDRIGKKPIKYYYNNKFFIFASELKAFINHPDITKEIDWEAVDEFLTYQYVPSPKTGFKNIWKLPPAHYMIVKPGGKIIIKRYWQIDFANKLDLADYQWEEAIENKLRESVKLRLQSDVSLGIHLSGGIDSGMITAIASIESKSRIKTFSIGFAETDYSELSYARLIADKYHSDHHEAIVKPDVIFLLPKLVYQYEEPFADPSILSTWLLMCESKKHFTVILNGDGGDENFAGYRRYQMMKLFNLLKVVPAKNNLIRLLYFIYKYYPQKDIAQVARIFGLSYSDYQLFYQDLVSFLDSDTKNKLYSSNFKQKIKESRSGDYLTNLFDKYNDFNLIDKLLYTDINTYLPEVLLVKTDIASMAHSLEARSPFLDHEFMELTAKMPNNLKLKGFDSKFILKKIAQNYLPNECFDRRKQGFIPPLDLWFRGKLKKYLKDQLLSENSQTLAIFKKEEIEKLIREHYEYKRDNAYALWTILCFNQWLNVWFKK